MGQIIGGAAKPKRCNIQSLSSLGTPAAGEYILVSSDNSMNAAGQGNFDCYIEGDGQKAATALPLIPLADSTLQKERKNAISNGAVFDAIQDINYQISSGSSFVLTPSSIAGIRASSPIVAEAGITLFYVPVTQGYQLSFLAVFTAGYIRWGFSTSLPANGVALTGNSAGGTGYSNYPMSFVSPVDGYFCLSLKEEAITSLTITGENPHAGIGVDLKNFKEKVEDELAKTETFPVETTSVNNMRISSSGVTSVSGEVAICFPVEKGKTYRFTAVFTLGYIRKGYTTGLPQAGMTVTDATAGGTGYSGTEFEITSTINGYYCCSFTASALTSFVVAEDNQNKGIGIDVAALEEKVAAIESKEAKELILTGRDNIEYNTTGTMPVESGKKYLLTIKDWASTEIRSNYSKLYVTLIKSANNEERALCDYKGNQYFPDTIFFETLQGEDTLKIYARITPQHVTTFVVEEISEISVFDFNPYNDSLVRLNDMRKTLKSGGTAPFTLLHFSDIHGDARNMARVTYYRQAFRELIDDIIHTGDIVASKVNATSFDFWGNVPNSAEVLNVIGNHDVWYEDGFTHDANYPYVTYFKPYIDNSDWGTIVQPANAEANNLCYYYKDYAAKNIRLIVLDYNEYAAADVAWFENALADAKTNGYHVIVAIHYQPAVREEFNTGFNIGKTIVTPASGGVASGFMNAVESFIQGGGNFVCWLSGHEHVDYCGVAGTNTRQVSICVDTAALRNDSNARYRAVDTRSQDAFNLISVNTNTKTIQVFRVGNDRDAMLRHIGVMCIDYANGTLLYTE